MLNMYEKEQALGYMILAGQSLKIEKDLLNKLVNQASELMEVFTEVVAEETYDEFLRRS